MKNLGYLLLGGGFLTAAFATALHTVETNWLLFAPAAIAGIAGVLIIKNQSRGEAKSAHVLSANRTELRESLENIVEQLRQIKSAGDTIKTDALRDEIDARLREDLRRFAEARESIIHLFGLQAYANVMSEFAAGERYVNRVWSASADGFGNEARTYVDRATERFLSAQQQLESVSVAAGETA